VADTEEKEAILKREMAEAWRGWLSIIFWLNDKWLLKYFIVYINVINGYDYLLFY
jgi:hypothetical protein